MTIRQYYVQKVPSKRRRDRYEKVISFPKFSAFLIDATKQNVHAQKGKGCKCAIFSSRKIPLKTAEIQIKGISFYK